MTTAPIPLSARRWSPSPIFVGLVAVTAVLGFVLWRDTTFPGPAGVFDGDGVLFAFVVCGWVVSVALHEFAHAAAAYHFGDRSVADKGYLDLDFRRYTDPFLSLVLPVVFVLLGGIGLPGGAVWINRAAIPSRWAQSMVSLAGPATNFVLGGVCLAIADLELWFDRPRFAAALAFLGFLQIAGAVLNMLPIPPLDGFGAIEPHLPYELRARLGPLRRWGLILVFVVLWYNDAANDAFWDSVGWFVELFGSDQGLAEVGWFRFRFWE